MKKFQVLCIEKLRCIFLNSRRFHFWNTKVLRNFFLSLFSTSYCRYTRRMVTELSFCFSFENVSVLEKKILPITLRNRG